jgi:hypothetical protein
MSPSHTTRKAGRYRYYVSQAMLQGRKTEAGSISRMAADELEGIVVDALRGAFPDTDRATDGAAIRGVALNDQVSSRDLGDHDQRARDLVSGHVERITIHATEIEILLRTDDVASPRSGSDGKERVLRVRLERRSRDRREIIVPDSTGMPAKSLDHSLVLSVARGRAWVNALRRGEYADTAEIARKFDLSEPYVKRMLRLAFLAPDVVEAIAEGRQPRGLTLQRLISPLPLAWREQRRQLGFAS